MYQNKIIALGITVQWHLFVLNMIYAVAEMSVQSLCASPAYLSVISEGRKQKSNPRVIEHDSMYTHM